MALHAYQITLLQAASDIATFLTEVLRPSADRECHLGAERLVDRGSCWIGWLAPSFEGIYEQLALFRRCRARRGFALEPTGSGLAEWKALWLPKVAQLGERLSDLPEWATDVCTTEGGLIVVDAVPNVRVVG